jgi:hypothetical protein
VKSTSSTPFAFSSIMIVTTYEELKVMKCQHQKETIGYKIHLVFVVFQKMGRITNVPSTYCLGSYTPPS